MYPSAATVLWTFGVAGIIATLAAFYFAYENITSQTIVISVAAFIGAFALLSIQLFLELRAESAVDLATAEYTFDQKLPELASGFYSDDHPGGIRAVVEQQTSATVAKKSPNIFKDNPPKVLATDMAIASFAAMLLSYQSDWQLRPIVLTARYTTGSQSAAWGSKDGECEIISADEIKSQLEATGNVFADLYLSLSGKRICLPPGSKILTTRQSIKITNPWCILTVTAQEPVSFLDGRPALIHPGRYRTIEHENMADGTPRYTNMPVALDIRIEYDRLYSKHSEMVKIRDWISRLVPAIHAWYEGTGNRFVQYKSPMEK